MIDGCLVICHVTCPVILQGPQKEFVELMWLGMLSEIDEERIAMPLPGLEQL